MPAADSAEPDEQAAREVFNGFAPEMKKALESGSLDEVNSTYFGPYSFIVQF